MTTLLEILLKSVAPHECILCCNEGNILCSECIFDTIDDKFVCCVQCGVPSLDYATCTHCQKKSHLSHAYVLGGYEEALKEATKRLKFEHSRQIAADIVVGWHEIMPQLPSNCIVTYIPTAYHRQRRRGFDQAELLARAFAAQRQLTYQPLFKRLSKARQVGASRQQRLQQAQSMFQLLPKINVNNKTLVLVDDIITTCATMNAAATMLHRAGAKHIIGLAIARHYLVKN